MVLETVTMMSCNGVAIKKLKSMLVAATSLKMVAACPEESFFDIWMKNIPFPIKWNTIPMNAQTLDGLSKPFSAFAPNKLLIKFFVQSNPEEFLS